MRVHEDSLSYLCQFFVNLKLFLKKTTEKLISRSPEHPSRWLQGWELFPNPHCRAGPTKSLGFPPALSTDAAGFIHDQHHKIGPLVCHHCFWKPDVTSATTICHQNGVWTAPASSHCWLCLHICLREVGPEYLAVQLFIQLTGALLYKRFPRPGSNAVARKKDKGLLWWLRPSDWNGQTRPLGGSTV